MQWPVSGQVTGHIVNKQWSHCRLLVLFGWEVFDLEWAAISYALLHAVPPRTTCIQIVSYSTWIYVGNLDFCHWFLVAFVRWITLPTIIYAYSSYIQESFLYLYPHPAPYPSARCVMWLIPCQWSDPSWLPAGNRKSLYIETTRAHFLSMSQQDLCQ